MEKTVYCPSLLDPSRICDYSTRSRYASQCVSAVGQYPLRRDRTKSLVNSFVHMHLSRLY